MLVCNVRGRRCAQSGRKKPNGGGCILNGETKLNTNKTLITSAHPNTCSSQAYTNFAPSFFFCKIIIMGRISTAAHLYQNVRLELIHSSLNRLETTVNIPKFHPSFLLAVGAVVRWRVSDSIPNAIYIGRMSLFSSH